MNGSYVVVQTELAKALVALQAELPVIGKDRTAKIPTKTGGAYTYRYADLSAVSLKMLPKLAKHGLAFLAKPTVNASGQRVLAYKLLHVSGEFEAGEWPLRQEGTAQEFGSEITYARRYALCAVTGVAPAADDDDAANASRANPKRQSWDEGEQSVLREGWIDELEKATGAEQLTELGASIKAAHERGELSPTTYAMLRAAGAKVRKQLEQ